MKTITDPRTETIQGLPNDLRLWSGERRLVELAGQTARVIAGRNPALGVQPMEPFDPVMMLTLFTYCYATDLHGSEDIEWATGSDAVVRSICAGANPDCQTVRRFRKANRQWIERCLVQVCNRVIAERVTGTIDQDVQGTSLEAGINADAAAWTRRKLELAIMMDAAAAD